MLFSRGDYSTFITQPVSATMLGLAALLLVWSVAAPLRQRLRARREGTPPR